MRHLPPLIRWNRSSTVLLSGFLLGNHIAQRSQERLQFGDVQKVLERIIHWITSEGKQTQAGASNAC